mgnify:FL=1
MGYKISAVLGLILLVSVAGSAWYIDRLLDEISVLKGNAITLENEIAKQNEAIKQHLESAKQTQVKMDELTKKNQEAQRQVSQLRDTFAKHDLDNLALEKPTLIQRSVNRGTKRVKDELMSITDPNQFDKDEEPTND